VLQKLKQVNITCEPNNLHNTECRDVINVDSLSSDTEGALSSYDRHTLASVVQAQHVWGVEVRLHVFFTAD
jgi:hypothetical protein